MKINIGAGKQTWPDYFCIDAVQHPKATRSLDMIYQFEFEGSRLKNKIDLNDECATEICCFHFIEHVHAWEAPAVINEFFRLLKPGSKLILELPDIFKAAQNMVNRIHERKSGQLTMWPLYGDPSTEDPFMCHKFGYMPETITALLSDCGFKKVKVLPPQTHGARNNRDMRVEAIKC